MEKEVGVPPKGEAGHDSSNRLAEGIPDNEDDNSRPSEQNQRVTETMEELPSEKESRNSALYQPVADAVPIPSRSGMSQKSSAVREGRGRSAIGGKRTSVNGIGGGENSRNLGCVGSLGDSQSVMNMNEISTLKSAEETMGDRSGVRTSERTPSAESSTLDMSAIEQPPPEGTRPTEHSTPTQDPRVETGGIIKVAEKLRNLESELKVDMLSQFEAFVRSKAGWTTGVVDVNQGDRIPGVVVMDAEGDSSTAHGINTDSESGRADLKSGSTEVDSGNTGTDIGSSGNDDLQAAINLAMARKKELLAECGADLGSSQVLRGSRTKGGGERDSGQGEYYTASTSEGRTVAGDKRGRSPGTGETDRGAPKIARTEYSQEDPDRTIAETISKTDAQDGVSDEMDPGGDRTIQEAGVGACDAEEQDMADVDGAIVTCSYSFSADPILLATARDEFCPEKNNFLKGCKWAPDGTCVLTNSDDGVLRLFNLPTELYSPQTQAPGPDLRAVLEMVEGELVYDYSWFPAMSSLSPETCCFASTSRGHPVHMWDAFTGQLRCSYRPHDHMDELITPHSLGFSLDGTRLYCGCNKLIKVFDTTRPGKDCDAKQTKSKLGRQTGIISCFAMSPDGTSYAAGSYSRTIGIYTDSCPSAITVLHGQSSGVTHLMYSIDGTKIYSGGRKDNEILCWDVRRSNDILFSLRRNVKTNQRIYFDIDREDHFLVSGNQDGSVTAWDLTHPCVPTTDSPHPTLEPITKFVAHDDTTNGVSIHPWLPLLATASGQRIIRPPRTGGSDGESDGEDNAHGRERKVDNSLKIWSLAGGATDQTQ